MAMSTADNALILFPGALGDFICFLPTLTGLRRRHTGRILLVAQPAVLELVPAGEIETASIDRREVADLFVAGSPLLPRTIELLAGFGSVYSWTGFGDPEFSQRLSLATGGRVQMHPFRGMQPGEHAAAYYQRCVDLRSATPRALPIAHDAEWMTAFEARHGFADQPVLVLHPGSGAPKKNWQGFSAVARYWRDRFDDTIVVLQGPAETQRASSLEADVLSVDGLTLPQVAALLRRSRLYLGNDSGVSHLAGAVGASGVVLFGPTDSAVWAPHSGRLQVVCAPKICTSCGPETFCVHRLPPERVVEALQRQRAV